MSYNLDKAVSILYANQSLLNNTNEELVTYFNTPIIIWSSASLGDIQAYLFKKKLDISIGQLAKIENPSNEILFALSRISQIFSATFKTLDLTDSDVLEQTIQVLDILVNNQVGTSQDKENLLDLGRQKEYRVDGLIDVDGVMLAKKILQAQINSQLLENELSNKVYIAKQRLQQYMNNIASGIDVVAPTITQLLE